MHAPRSIHARLATAAAAALLLSSAPAARAGISFSIEAPGVQSSLVAPSGLTETFNARALGSYTAINSVIGTYSATAPGAMVVAPDAFGGANQTQYLAVGAQSAPTTSVDLTFAGPQSYFGLYWGAVDAQNRLEIYDGATLLDTIDRADIVALTGLSGPYFGNPNTGQNQGEPYAYVNVFGTAGTTFTSVRFVNNGTGTGFETDNHTIVPEPASLVSAGIGALGLLGLGLRRRAKAGRPATA